MAATAALPVLWWRECERHRVQDPTGADTNFRTDAGANRAAASAI
jgi:hypothetical protein